MVPRNDSFELDGKQSRLKCMQMSVAEKKNRPLTSTDNICHEGKNDKARNPWDKVGQKDLAAWTNQGEFMCCDEPCHCKIKVRLPSTRLRKTAVTCCSSDQEHRKNHNYNLLAPYNPASVRLFQSWRWRRNLWNITYHERIPNEGQSHVNSCLGCIKVDRQIGVVCKGTIDFALPFHKCDGRPAYINNPVLSVLVIRWSDSR